MNSVGPLKSCGKPTSNDHSGIVYSQLKVLQLVGTTLTYLGSTRITNQVFRVRAFEGKINISVFCVAAGGEGVAYISSLTEAKISS